DRAGFDDGDREPRSAGLHLAIDVIVELRRALAVDADRVRHRCNAVPEFPEQRHGDTVPVAATFEFYAGFNAVRRHTAMRRFSFQPQRDAPRGAPATAR